MIWWPSRPYSWLLPDFPGIYLLPFLTSLFLTSLLFLKHIEHVPGHPLPRPLHGQLLTIQFSPQRSPSGKAFPDHAPWTVHPLHHAYFILFVPLTAIWIILCNSLFTSLFSVTHTHTHNQLYFMRAENTCLSYSKLYFHCLQEFNTSLMNDWLNEHRFPTSWAPALWVKPELYPFTFYQVFANKYMANTLRAANVSKLTGFCSA